MSKFRNSIQGRLLMIFLLTLLPVYAIGMYIHTWGVRSMRQAVEERSLTQLEVYCNNLENDIQRLISLQIDVINGIELAWLANMHSVMSDYERGKAINDLQQRLHYLSSSSIYSLGAAARILSLELGIDSTGGARPLTETDTALMQASTPKQGLPLIIQDGELYTSIAFQVAGQKILYNVSVRLSQDQIRSELEQQGNQDGICLAIFQNGALTINSDSSAADYSVETTYFLLEQFDTLETGNGIVDLALHETDYLAMYSKSEKLGMTICSLIPKKTLYEPAERFMLMMWIYLIAGISVLLLFAVFIRRTIHRPMQLLVQAFGQMEDNDLSTAITYSGNDEYGYLFGRFNHMVAKLRALIHENYEKNLLLRNAELKQLQTQINPHFLYNSYFLLHRMIQSGDQERAAQFSGYLGQYMRYITRNARDMIPLEQEIDHAKVYTDIQALRFTGRIQIDFSFPPKSILQLQVPRLILQPLMENAFEHGLRDKRIDGLLQIHFQLESDSVLHVYVEDNGEGLTDQELIRLNEDLQNKEEDAERTGLLNIHFRLRLQYGENSGLTFSRSASGGLCVRLTIYFKEKPI